MKALQNAWCEFRLVDPLRSSGKPDQGPCGFIVAIRPPPVTYHPTLRAHNKTPDRFQSLGPTSGTPPMISSPRGLAQHLIAA